MPSVLVRRDSEFGLLRDIEKRTQILGRSLEGCWGPAPRPPGFIALRHQQVLLNGLAGFERTEAGVAAEGSHCAGRSPAMLGSENLATASLRRSSCFSAEPCPGTVKRWRNGQNGMFQSPRYRRAALPERIKKTSHGERSMSIGRSRPGAFLTRFWPRGHAPVPGDCHPLLALSRWGGSKEFRDGPSQPRRDQRSVDVSTAP